MGYAQQRRVIVGRMRFIWRIKVALGNDILKGCERGLLVWGKIVEVARGDVGLDLLAFERLGLGVRGERED